MLIGIVGLGLIGGSIARAVKEKTGHCVVAFDISESAFLEANLVGAVDGVLDDKSLPKCDIVINALYPALVIDYVKQNAKLFKKDSVVIDCGGVKREICDTLMPIAKENGFHFIGGHPMAGTQFWGFRYSRGSLFNKAPIILTLPDDIDINILEKIKAFFTSIGFKDIVFTSPDEHDRIIAYTSQLPHVISSAYIKSPSAADHKGFSAGSYKDMSRVAKLNEDMWSELFLCNKDYLISEIDVFIEKLSQYRNALLDNNEEELRNLLKDGRILKENIEKGVKSE